MTKLEALEKQELKFLRKKIKLLLKEKTMWRKFALWLSKYEKKPPEIMKDDFAYDRLLDFMHECGTTMLKRAKAIK